MRDLRADGWVIHTNREDPGLSPNTLCFAKAGDDVWDPRASRKRSGPDISNKERMAVIAADDYMCTVCGIAGGEVYPDSRRGETAQLSVSSREEALPDGTTSDRRFITECKRCRAGRVEDSVPQLAYVLAEIDALEPADREELAQWVRRDRRRPRRIDQLWTEYRGLPSASRDAVAERLRTRA
jgi:hypothetical protein